MDPITVIIRSCLIVFLIALFLYSRRAINAVDELTIKNKNLASENEELALINHFLRELGGDTNSVYLDTKVINQLSLRTIKLFFINLHMYNLHRVREFDGRMLGQYLQGYFTEIEDEGKRNYFYSVLSNALVSQSIEKLINLFLTILKMKLLIHPLKIKKIAQLSVEKHFEIGF